MEKGNIKLESLEQKINYSNKVIQSLIFDKIFKDEYDISTSTLYNHAETISLHIGVGFRILNPEQHKKYYNESSGKVRLYFNKLAERVSTILPDEMPTSTTDRSFAESKKIIKKLLIDLENQGALEDLVGKTENIIITNEKNREVFDQWADSFKRYIDDTKSTGHVK